VTSLSPGLADDDARASGSSHRAAASTPKPAHKAKAGAGAATEGETGAEENVNPWITQQLCVGLPDDSEFCRYRGPVCLTGGGHEAKFIFASHISSAESLAAASRAGKRRQSGGSFADENAPREEVELLGLYGDMRGRCLDFRYYERHGSCVYEGPFGRDSLPEEAFEDPVKYAQTHKPYTAPLSGRTWLPDEHGGSAMAVPWDILAASSLGPLLPPQGSAVSPADFDLSVGPGADAALEAKWGAAATRRALSLDRAAIAATALTLRGRGTLVPPSKLQWMDGSAYMVWWDNGWSDHPWHMAAATFQLFALKMQNLTVQNVPLGSRGSATGPLNFTLGMLPLPPMDYLIPVGGYDPPRHELKDLGQWSQGVLPLLMQPQTRLLMNGVLKDREAIAEDGKWICFKDAVMAGIKPYVFTGITECQAWREMAYALIGHKTPPAWQSRPRPMITILDRSTRGFYDAVAIAAAVNATGLPWKRVSDLDRMSYEDQVRVFADTGILVATHGGALAHVMHLPLHAVVIEMFPYMLGNNIYEKLSHMCNLHYYKLIGTVPPGTNARAKAARAARGPTPEPRTRKERMDAAFDALAEDSFIANCEYPDHMGRYDGALNGDCDYLPKQTAVHVDINLFKSVLGYALSDIGCRDSVCRVDSTRVGPVTYRDYRTGEAWHSHLPGPDKEQQIERFLEMREQPF
jgi:hypothetical protein